MKESIITKLRDKETSINDFRSNSKKIADILAQKTFGHIKQRNKKVETPVGKAEGADIDQDIVLLPILRSGLAFLPTFLKYYENAKVGFMGLERDEGTTEPHRYYYKMPELNSEDKIIILDPMIATGGTAEDTIKELKQDGVKEKQILFVSFIVAPEGIERLKDQFKEVNFITEVIDKKLNKDKFIVPGIGDFGDRYFGTLNNN